jgi:choloylglycine hydrolase
MCTDFLLTAADEDHSVVVGRSMEFGEDLGSQILVGGRGTKKHGGAPDSPLGGLSWTAKYGYVGLNVAGLELPHLICDGMNEKGLSIGALWLPGYTQYSPTVSNKAQALDVKHFTNWVLGNFETVAEVKTGLTDVQVWGGSLTNAKIPIHFSIHDANGASAVLEFLEGNTQGLWQPSTVGVLTNAPPFAWQLANIGNYVGLSSVDAAPITIGGTAYPPPGHGSGMRGLPLVIPRRPHGSYVSCSRSNSRRSQRTIQTLSARQCICSTRSTFRSAPARRSRSRNPQGVMMTTRNGWSSKR